jgi:phage terminase large subunit-like protein
MPLLDPATVRRMLEARAAVEAESARRAACQFYRLFPDDGPYRRELYPKHLAWFAAGREHRERLLIAANRVGKTLAGGYELVAHLTGEYPSWWTGRRFDHPVRAWAAGDTAKTVRDIVQDKLLGPVGAWGSGLIPSHRLEGWTLKAGVPDAVESVGVSRPDGGVSVLQLKSYDQRREAFQGTAQHVVLLDEEPPMEIYVESLLRMTETSDFAGGILMLTFTPLMGLTPLILSFLPGGRPPGASQ